MDFFHFIDFMVGYHIDFKEIRLAGYTKRKRKLGVKVKILEVGIFCLHFVKSFMLKVQSVSPVHLVHLVVFSLTKYMCNQI
jgi:hypothetical protein